MWVLFRGNINLSLIVQEWYQSIPNCSRVIWIYPLLLDSLHWVSQHEPSEYIECFRWCTITWYVSRSFVTISLNKGGSICPLMTARMTNRRTGTAISRMVMNQWRRFSSRFFHRSTRNFENVLMFVAFTGLVQKEAWSTTTLELNPRKVSTLLLDGERGGYARKNRCPDSSCVVNDCSISLFHKSRNSLSSYQLQATSLQV